MYSSIFDLSNNPEEVLLRLHPNKKKSYDAMLDGTAEIEQDGKPINIKDIFLSVNKEEKIKYLQCGFFPNVKFIDIIVHFIDINVMVS